MLLGEKVAKIALGEVGVSEHPPGSNSGTKVRSYQMATDLGGTGWPWCGAFVAWCYKMAHCPDDHLTSASTAVTYERAKSSDAIIKQPRVGAMICWPGVHIGIIVENLGDGLVRTVEGNSGDAVRVRTRKIGENGSVIIAPLAIRKSQPAPAPRVYYIERVDAKPRLLGPWQLQASRDKAYGRLPSNLKRTARKIRTQGNKYGILVGPRKILGPWATKAQRDVALKTLRARGENVRPYSKPKATVNSADSLGKTT